MLKIALIGVGYWGPNLLRNLVENPDCDLRMVVDISEERRDFVRTKYKNIDVFENIDDAIKNLKGEDRPTQSQTERLTVIGSVRYVDIVLPQKKYDPSDELRKIGRVDILTKGDDWDYIPGTETIKKMGGKLVCLSYTDGFSTSQLVSKLGNKEARWLYLIW